MFRISASVHLVPDKHVFSPHHRTTLVGVHFAPSETVRRPLFPTRSSGSTQDRTLPPLRPVHRPFRCSRLDASYSSIFDDLVTPSLAAPRANRQLRPRHPAHRCIARFSQSPCRTRACTVGNMATRVATTKGMPPMPNKEDIGSTLVSPALPVRPSGSALFIACVGCRGSETEADYSTDGPTWRTAYLRSCMIWNKAST